MQNARFVRAMSTIVSAVLLMVVLPTRLSAAPLFSLNTSAFGNISRSDVVSTMTTVYQRSDPLFSSVDNIAVQHGFDDRSGCLVYAALDQTMGRLTLFHWEQYLAEEHFLYSGGQPGGGEREFNGPSDVALWGIHYSYSSKTYANYYVYHVFVADTFNNRIQHLLYYTHCYDVDGSRVADHIEYSSPIGAETLTFPTSVDLAAWNDEKWLVVADAGNHSIRIFDGSFNLIRTITASDLGLPLFQPLKIACLEGPSTGDLYIGVSLGNGNMQPAAGSNLAVIHVAGASASVVSQDLLVQGVQDIAASAPMSFCVLDKGMLLHQVSASGQALNTFDLNTLGIAASSAKCIAATKYDLACGFDYDSDSGISLLSFSGGCIDVRAGKDHFFPAYEPITLHYSVVEPGTYTAALCLASDNSVYLWLPDAPTDVGVHDYALTHIPAIDKVQVRLRLRQIYSNNATKSYYSPPFTLNICPVIAIAQPQAPPDGASLCYAQKIDVVFDLEYPDLSSVQKVSVMCRRHGTETIDKTRNIVGLVQGTNRSYLAMPSVDPCRYDIVFRGVMYGGSYSEYIMNGTVLVHSCADTMPVIFVEPLPMSRRSIEARMATSDAVAIMDRDSGTACVIARAAAGRMVALYDMRGRRVAMKEMHGADGSLAIARFSCDSIGSGVYYARIAGGHWPTVRIAIVK